ncbi:MAG: hypothetical protein ACAI43_23040 [Phycisphaerae bacterium]
MTDHRLDEVLPAEGPIVSVFQQAGGNCMRYPHLAGSLVRLAANDGNGVRPLGDPVRAFRAMAEDPDLRLLAAEFPVLRALVCTAGDPYTPAQLRRLDAYLRRYVDLPPLAGGIEACVRFAPCDPLAHLGGWQVLSCGAVEAGRRRWQPYPTLPGLHFEQGNIKDLALDESGVLDEDLVGRIADVGRLLGLHAPPGLFLMWENAD